jgi:hypothetical protein
VSGPRYGTIDHDYGLRLATTEPADDGPVWMVNLMKYRDVADYADGRETTRTGRDADDEYTPLGPLEAIGAEIVYAAEVDSQLLGEGAPWDRIGIVKYPTRRSFIEMQQREDFKAQHVHKDAGMERTIVMGCQPMPLIDNPHRVDVGDVEHPPTADDPGIHVLHVLRYNEGAYDEMQAYSSVAAVAAGRHGGGMHRWFEVEGTILGDGRAWDQVRFNDFPSTAAFMAVVADPDRLVHQADHREPAIADTYTMILRPLIDRLHESLDAG